MKLLTIQQFADKHGVSKKTIEYQMREGKIEWIEEYGKRLIPSRTRYIKHKR